MKATRYLNPDRHLQQAMGNHDMTNNNNNNQPNNGLQDLPGDNAYETTMGQTMEVDVGKSMPPTQPSHLPLLHTEVQAVSLGEPIEGGQARSMVGEGMHFVGHALLRGPCSVAGLVEGNLTQAPHLMVAVVVTETGRVKGDITAQKISVMGRTEGILDAGQGEVALHDTASVHGLVRYGRIQVNGADLNATLERVAIQKPGA